jgi:hypothetical protein
MRTGRQAKSDLRRASAWIAAGLGAMALTGASPSGALAATSAPAAAGGTLTGYWRLTSHGAETAPVLTAWAKGEMKKVETKGDIDVESVRWCVFQGMPYVMDNAGPIDIIEAPNETVIAAERIAVVRHLYTTRQAHPSEDVFDNTVVGNSLGKWVGGVFVVDTVGFGKGVGAGGAPRTDKTHLVERFRLADGGKHLTLTSTWSDPQVFAKPYVQTWIYERLPTGYSAEEYYCDPRANGVGHP